MTTSIIGFFNTKESAQKRIETLLQNRSIGNNSTYNVEFKAGVGFIVIAKINYSKELQTELDNLFTS